MSDSDTVHSDAEWLTYREAARRLGVTGDAIRKRAQRERWLMQRDNQGRVSVQVPAVLSGSERPMSDPDNASRPTRILPRNSGAERTVSDPDMGGLSTALATIAELRNQVDQLTRFLAAEQAARDADRLDRAAERAAWSTQMQDLAMRSKADQVRADQGLAAAFSELAGTRAELDRLRSRGLVARMLNRV